MQRFRPHLRAHGLTDQQWRILRALAEIESAEMLELAMRCCIHPASLSRIIPRLAERQLVRRRTDSLDQRRVIVSLAPDGRALFQAMAAESERIYAQLRAEIGPERLDALYRALDEAIDRLGGTTGAPPAEEE
jgi:homoprotocatechuate degradation regulator HpaR